MSPVLRALTLGAVMAVLAVACGGRERPEGEEDRTTEAEAPLEAEAASETSELTCAEMEAAGRVRLHAFLDTYSECVYDTDCVAQPGGVFCGEPCGVVLHPRGVASLAGTLETILEEECDVSGPARCPIPNVDCAPARPSCIAGRCSSEASHTPAREMPIPAENAASLSDNPPTRPAPGEAEQERGQRLFDAIVHDDPVRIGDFFFPREAFAVVKAIADPDGYWQRLFRRFSRDIHELHETLVEEHGDLSGLRFGRLDIIRRGGWVPLREEGNALPYWVSRHSQLYYTVGQEDGEEGGEEGHFEVRVLITWGERWYVTHLKEFH